MLRVRATLSGWAGGPGLNTWYFETPLQDAAAALRCVDYVHAQWAGGLQGVLPDSVNLQVQGEVDVITAATGAITDTLSVTTPAVCNGTGGSAYAPPECACLLKLNTSTYVAGRRIQGRMFLSPLAAAVIGTDGQMDHTIAGGVDNAYADMTGRMDAGDTWVVWHRPKSGAGGSAALITATSVPYKVAVLTSRRD